MMKKSQATHKKRATKKNGTMKKRKGGGFFDILMGAQRIRGNKYEPLVRRPIGFVFQRH